MTRRLLIGLLGAVALCAATLAIPAAAFGHAAFVGSSPDAGQRVEAAPRDVTLSFTEPLNVRLSSVEVSAVDGGEDLEASVRALRGRQLVVSPTRPLPTGAYRLTWHTVSTEDGHALEGSFSFGVRAPAAGGDQVVEQSPLARNGWLRVGLRWLLYVSALLFVAALMLPWLVARSSASWLVPATLGADGDTEGLRGRERRLTGDLGWLAALAAVSATLAEAYDAAGSLEPTALRDFLLSNVAGGARAAVVVALAVAALLWQRAPRSAAGAGVLALGAIAASGHASSASPRVPSVLNDWLHLGAGAAWLGGIGLIVLVWGTSLARIGPVRRLALAREVLVPFGRVALPAFLLVSATGLVSLLTQLGHVSALWETGYGQLLGVKILIVGAIAAVSAAHALRLRPRLLHPSGAGDHLSERRHWRLLRTEPLLGLGVVAVVAFLVAFPLPPRQLGQAGEARAAGPACDPCPLPRPAADELPVAGGAGSHLVAAWVRRAPTGVSGVVRVIDIRGRPERRPYRVQGASTRECGVGCQRFQLSADQPLRVTVPERGRSYGVTLPTHWRADGNRRARRLLVRAQKAMRTLRSVREVEQVTSGPGSYARTVYRLRAPDRMTLTTNRGVQTVIAGKRRWLRTADTPWEVSSYGSGLPFRTRTWFRWTTYGRSVRLLGVGRRDGRRVAELGLMDEGTPVWFRLTVALDTGRVLAEQMATKAHFMRARFQRFDQPTTIALPDAG